MPRFEKWLANVAPDEPVDRVARRALKTRLRAVVWYLQAAGGGEEEAEAVHQLRIWTRRAASTLRLFAPAMPRRAAEKLKRTLRKLRRAAGEVRDCDVYLEQLQDDSHEPRRIIKALQSQRREAQRKLKKRRRKLSRGDRFERQAEAVLADIAWPKRHSSREAPDFAPWCRQQLAALAKDFFALALPAGDAQLHELRKSGKRLRYALELAAAAIPPRVHHRLYEDLSDLQDRLGEVCDHLVAAERIRRWQADAKQGKHQRQLAELLEQEEQGLATARRQFQRWWSAARRGRWQKQWQTLEASSATRSR